MGQLHHVHAKALSSKEIAQVIAQNEHTDDPKPLWREINPYAGLRAQESGSAAYFFGRERKTVEIINNLRRRPGSLHVLVGNSGVGKSSVVNAGVLGALRSQQWPQSGEDWPEDLEDSRTWQFLSIKPGETPVKELANAFAGTWIEDPGDREDQALKWLRNFRNGSSLGDLVRAARNEIAAKTGDAPPRRILLNIDQKEELYTRANREDARLFARLLVQATAIPEILMISSLRADYYGALQGDTDLFPVSNWIDVPPLTASETEDVIKLPAEKLGAVFATPEIFPRLAQAAVASPGGMPLLSYMLTRVWEQMRSDDASDGHLYLPPDPLNIAEPLISRAKTFLRQHLDDEDALRRLFTLRLAHVPKIGEPVSRRAWQEECKPDEWRLATELSGEDWRLLTTSELNGTVMAEVAHEALLSNWPKLPEWFEAEREFLVWKGSLETARQDHNADPHDGTLLMGTPLEKAREKLASYRDQLSREDRRFIVASLWAERKRRLQNKAREADLVNTRKKVRVRQLWLVRGSIVAVILVGTVAIFARLQWTRAEDGLELAEQQGIRAEKNLAQAQTETERREVEWARYVVERSTLFVRQGQPDHALALVVSAFPVEARDRWTKINRLSAASGVLEEAWSQASVLEILRGHGEDVTSAAFSRDGTLFVTASFDGTVRLWDAATGKEIKTLPGPERGPRGSGQGARSAVFSPDGTRIISTSLTTARVWNTATGKEILSLNGHEGNLISAAFSPDGTRIVTASDDWTARLWDATTGEEIITLRGHEGFVQSAAFSPDGTWIVTASQDNTARLWDAAIGEEIITLRGHEGLVDSASFSPDGTRIVTASWDKTARLWDAATGKEIIALRGHDGGVNSAAVSPDGTRIITASDDKSARLWNAATGEEIRSMTGHDGFVYSASFSPDGNRILTASGDWTARVWDANSGARNRHLKAQSWVLSAGFSPDGTRIFAITQDHVVRIWDAAKGDEIHSLRGHGLTVNSVSFSPDGTRIVTASVDQTARVWDASSGEEIHSLTEHEGWVLSATFSPDGTRIVTASSNRTARLWDAATGEEIVTLRGHGGSVRSAAFSPDGTRIVTASADGTARIWDAFTGEEIIQLTGHEEEVESAVFSPDGTRIVTASVDQTARIWDAATGKETQNLTGHLRTVIFAVFSPDGTRIVTGSMDMTARIWDAISLEDLVDLARARVEQADVLTLDQRCALYMADEGCP